MRITNKPNFRLGVFDILLGTALVIVCIVLHRGIKILCAMFPIVLGISLLICSVETEKQRQEKEVRIKAQARLLGWKDD